MDRKWWTLIAVCFGTFMLLLDITVVNVALPDIQIALHSTFQDLQWVVDAYALTLAAFLLTAGVLGDMYGRKGMFAIGLVLFSLASLTCGLAATPLILNLSRAAQGVGGAIMFATSLALIAQAFAGKQRGTAIGVYGAVIGGAVAIGPLVGGAITTGIGWRWIFFLNIPIGVVAVIITLTKVDNAKIQTGRTDRLARVRHLHLVTLPPRLRPGAGQRQGVGQHVHRVHAGGLRRCSWPSSSSASGSSGTRCSTSRCSSVRPWSGSRSARSPCRPRSSPCSSTSRSTCRRSSATRRWPPACGSCPSACSPSSWRPSPASSPCASRSRFLMSLGLLLVAVGCQLMTDVAGDSAWTVLLPGFLVCGLGVGLTNPVLASGAVSVVPPERSGMSSGAASTFRQVGIATGIAGLGAIFVHEITPAVISNLKGSAAGQSVLQHGGQSLGSALASGSVRQVAASIPTAASRQALVSAYQDGFASTFNHLMAIASVIALIGAVGCLFLVRQKDFVPSIGAGEWSPAKASDGDVTPVAAPNPDANGATTRGDEGPTPASPARTG